MYLQNLQLLRAHGTHQCNPRQHARHHFAAKICSSNRIDDSLYPVVVVRRTTGQRRHLQCLRVGYLQALPLRPAGQTLVITIAESICCYQYDCRIKPPSPNPQYLIPRLSQQRITVCRFYALSERPYSPEMCTLWSIKPGVIPWSSLEAASY